MLKLARSLLPWLLLAAAGTAPAVEDLATITHEKTLDNGLKVVVREDHRAPVVTSMVWYKVGSSYEHSGITGVSHVLEHMMFQGTDKHPPNEFSRIIAAHGGQENAFTSRDYTAYYQRLEKSNLPISFELEADRMRNLLLKEDQFDKERKVVMEERRLRTEDNPQSLTYERFMATAFMASPYQHPVIGWMDDLEHMKLQDLADWYRMWYAPNNAVLVVVGDVDPKEVFALAEKHFGPLEPSVIDPPKPRREPEHNGERRVTVREPAELPMLLLGYRAPVLGNAETEWKPYALDVLAGVLDGGDSARLSRELVRGSQIAASAGAGYSLYGLHDGLFILSGVPSDGHSMAELEKALRGQVQRLAKEPVDPAELERVKAQVVASEVFQRDSGSAQANQIGKLETLGLGWRVGEAYPERIRAVTAEQVQQVAREFLTDERLTVAQLEPLPLEPGKKPAPMQGGMHDVVE